MKSSKIYTVQLSLYLHISYYIIIKNSECSLSLLEAARPAVRLTNEVHGWLIPLDSIRMIEDQGLITGAVYRPSRTTKIKYLASRVSPESRGTAIVLARGSESEGPAANGNIP